MMWLVALGEAYISVRADLRPFARDLKQQVKKIADDFEKDLNKHLSAKLGPGGEKAGEKLGDGVSRGMRKKLADKNLPLWKQIFAALGSALDDGLSALPTEVKATIVAGMLVASPFVAASLAGAVSAGLGVGVVGLGVALASQYAPVQEQFAESVINIRKSLVRSAIDFGPALMHTLVAAENRIVSWEPLLARTFGKGAPLLQPLVDGLLGAVEEILGSLDVSMDEIGPFVEVLADGFVNLGDAIGDAFEILVDSGEDGREGLKDLIDLTGSAIRGFAGLLWFLSKVYGVIRDIYQAVSPLNALLNSFGAGISDVDQAIWVAGNDADGTTKSFYDLITATDKEEKAAKDAAAAVREQARALDEARDAAFGAIDAHIGYERALDNLHDALNENGDTLSFETERGRENLEKFGAAIRNAQKDAEARYTSGELNSLEARRLYDAEIGKIYQLAAAHGVTKRELDKVYGRTLDLINLPNPSPEAWEAYATAAAATARELERAVRMAKRLRDFAAKGVPNAIRWGVGSGVEGFAEGDIINKEQIARVGEGNKPEVIIPLTKPQRAMQLAERSGLTRMLGNMASTVVQVFVGDEPLEQKMIRVVQGSNRALGLSLAQGTR